jgi:anti-sigma factor RsiW
MSADVETLVQRFLDGELSRAERQTMLRLLGSRSDLRQRLVDDEALLDAVANLPRAVPGPDFVARTMAALPMQVPREDAPARRPALTVQRLTLAAAASLLLVAGFWAGRESTGQDPVPVAAVDTPDSAATVLVRLVLIAPDAETVSVAGDFNGWDPGRSPLERGDSGVWTALVPLEEGRYQYMFFVDGQRWVADPLAAESSSDGFGAQNSVIDVEI